MDVARQVIPCLLGAVVGLSAPLAHASNDRERSFHELEARSKLDLDKLWLEYQRKADLRPFAQFVEARYRRQRDVGRGLLFGGAGVGVVAAAMFFLALPRNDAAAVTYTSYGLMGATAGMMIAGGVIWRKNFRRLERLETEGIALGPRGRLRLRSVAPVALPRGAAISVGLAF